MIPINKKVIYSKKGQATPVNRSGILIALDHIWVDAERESFANPDQKKKVGGAYIEDEYGSLITINLEDYDIQFTSPTLKHVFKDHVF